MIHVGAVPTLLRSHGRSGAESLNLTLRPFPEQSRSVFMSGFLQPRRLRTGAKPSAAEFNAVAMRADALNRITSDGRIGVERSGFGIQITDLGQPQLLGRITSRGSGANYGWNQVIDNGDGTFTDQPLIPECPHGTATIAAAWEIAGRTDVPTDGTAIVELVPGQQDEAAFYFSYASSSSSESPTTSCKQFGWLLSGPRSNKVWRVRVSEAIGQCADCTTIDPAFDGTTDRIAYHTSSPTSTQEIWEVAGNLELCGGCATARILTDRNATTPAGRAQLELTYKSAVDGSIVTKTVDAECTPDDGTVVWAVAADDLCPEPDNGDYPCASLIRVVAECIACDIGNAVCTKCIGQVGPPIFKIVGSGFSDVDEVYNGTWYPKWSSGCTWTVTCGEVTVSAVVDCTTVTVTFSGGGGGGATYVYTNANGIFCFQTHTADRDTGDSLTTPESLDIVPMSCTLGSGSLSLNITASDPCGSGDYTAAPMGNDFGDPSIVAISGGPGDGTCPSFGLICFRQANGKFTVLPYCNDITSCITGDVCYAGGPSLTDLENESSTPGEVLLTFDWEIDCCGTPETVTIMLEGS